MQASTLSIMIRNVLYAFPFKLIKLKARHFYRNLVCLQISRVVIEYNPFDNNLVLEGRIFG